MHLEHGLIHASPSLVTAVGPAYRRNQLPGKVFDSTGGRGEGFRWLRREPPGRGRTPYGDLRRASRRYAEDQALDREQGLFDAWAAGFEAGRAATANAGMRPRKPYSGTQDTELIGS